MVGAHGTPILSVGTGAGFGFDATTFRLARIRGRFTRGEFEGTTTGVISTRSAERVACRAGVGKTTSS
ncbi:hypothetical protein GTO10_01790 [Candidatus Saccharibacteria bacterium]|nr:hypothetical protein [Candidatus Saccharibacteria bacterium]